MLAHLRRLVGQQVPLQAPNATTAPNAVPRRDDTPGGSNGGGRRLYAHGPGIPVRQPVQVDGYLTRFKTRATTNDELDPVLRTPARDSRRILQRTMGGQAGQPVFWRNDSSGGHAQVVRSSSGLPHPLQGRGDSASPIEVITVRDLSNHYTKDQRRKVVAGYSREGTTFGISGDQLAPPGTAQLRPYPTVRRERARVVLPTWNGGER